MSDGTCERPGCSRPKSIPEQHLALDPLGTGLIEPDLRDVDDDGKALALSLSVRLCEQCTRDLELWWTDRNAYDTAVRTTAIPRIAACALRIASGSTKKGMSGINTLSPHLRDGATLAHETIAAGLEVLADKIEVMKHDELAPELLASVREDA